MYLPARMVYLASTAGSYINLVITFHVNANYLMLQSECELDDHKSRQNFRDCLCPIRTCGQGIETTTFLRHCPNHHGVRQTLYLKHTSN